jgi:hypothetical protein
LTPRPAWARRWSPRGKALLERHLEALVRPGFPGLHLHLRKIGRDSWGPAAELVTAQIGAVPRFPAAPHSGPFTPYATRARKQAAYRQARAMVDRAQRTAQAQLRAILRQADRAPFPVEQGTDVTGCAAAFGTLWAAMPGPHSLTILSDLAPKGRNTSVAFHLSGQTAVTVVLYCADQTDAAACEARGAAFGRQITRAGATSYHVYDSANVAFVPVPH